MSLDVRLAPDAMAAIDALDADAFKRRGGGILRRHLRAMGNTYRRAVRAELKPHRFTGKMAGRVRVLIQGRSLASAMRLATGQGTNLIVGGVRPHRIEPGKVMPMWAGKGAWKGGKGAGIVGFARAVEHPGFPPDPYVAKGIAAARPEVDRQQQTLTNELRDLLIPRKEA